MCYNVHENLKSLDVAQLQELSKQSRLPYSVCLMNLEYDLNIGNCIRSAHILGAERVFIFGKRKYDSRSTVGAHNYIDVVKYDFQELTDESVIGAKFEEMVTSYKLRPIIIEKTDISEDIRDIPKFSMTDNMCLVFGNEQNGIPECISSKYPCYHINQRGVIRSMNVASAAAIAMYEFSNKLERIYKNTTTYKKAWV